MGQLDSLLFLLNIFSHIYTLLIGFPGGLEVKASASNVGDPGSIPGSGWQPTPVFLPGESHGWRSLGRLQSTGSQRVGHD